MTTNPYAAPAHNEPHAPESNAGIFARDRYFLKQKLFALINETYRIFDEHGGVLLYVQRPGMIGRNLLAMLAIIGGLILAVICAVTIITIAGSDSAVGVVLALIIGGIIAVAAIIGGIVISPRRGLVFCRDEGLTQALLWVSQDNRMTFPSAHFTLRDAGGQVLCRFHKNILWNLVRRRWVIAGPDGSTIAMAKEDSILKSIIRRVAPDIIAAFMRTNFIYLDSNGRTIGAFNRKLAIRDHYTLDLRADPEQSLDRRIAVAMCVLLDTGERR